MPAMHLPSPHALYAQDESMLRDELRVVATAGQLAVVRTLADEIRRCIERGIGVEALREQLAEEIARLGCRCFEAAASMAVR